jgi:hypothetical protein
MFKRGRCFNPLLLDIPISHDNTGVSRKGCLKIRQKYLTMDFGSASVPPAIVWKEVIGGSDMKEALGENPKAQIV